MAFVRSSWKVLAATDVLNLFGYETADDATATNYFSPLWNEVRVSDLIFVDSGSATTVYRVSARNVNSVTVEPI